MHCILHQNNFNEFPKFCIILIECLSGKLKGHVDCKYRKIRIAFRLFSQQIITVIPAFKILCMSPMSKGYENFAVDFVIMLFPNIVTILNFLTQNFEILILKIN